VVAVIGRTHGMTPAYVPMDRIMCALAWDGQQVPYHRYIEYALEDLRRRGYLSATAAGWRVV
jgi:hypothetical protein